MPTTVVGASHVFTCSTSTIHTIFTCINSFNPHITYEVGVNITPILQVRRLRPERLIYLPKVALKVYGRLRFQLRPFDSRARVLCHTTRKSRGSISSKAWWWFRNMSLFFDTPLYKRWSLISLSLCVGWT